MASIPDTAQNNSDGTLIRTPLKKIQHLASPLATIGESNSQTWNADSPNSSPAQSFAGSTTGYANLLKDIPGFAPYIYAGSSEINSEINGKVTTKRSSGGPDTGVPREDPTVSSALQNMPDGVFAAPSVDILSRLKKIAYKRQQLVDVQLEVEDIGTELRRGRQVLDREVKSATLVVDDDQLVVSDISEIRAMWRGSLSKLRESLKMSKAFEQDLEPLQRHITQLQFELRSAVEELYASMTAGADIGDSEASREDQILDLLMSPIPSSPRTPSFNDALQAHGTELALYSIDNQSQKVPDRSSFGTNSPIRQQHDNDSETRNHSPQKARSHSDEGVGGPPIPSSRASKPHWLLRSDLIAFGSHLTVGTLDERIRAANACPMLNGTGDSVLAKQIQQIRRKDLHPELTANIFLRLSSSTTGVSEGASKTRPSVSQKFSNIGVQSLHLKDLVSMWGSSMSQNSWLDLKRTEHYGALEAQVKRRHALDKIIRSRDVIDLTNFLRVLDIPSLPILMKKARSHRRVQADNMSTAVQMTDKKDMPFSHPAHSLQRQSQADRLSTKLIGRLKECFTPTMMPMHKSVTLEKVN